MDFEISLLKALYEIAIHKAHDKIDTVHLPGELADVETFEQNLYVAENWMENILTLKISFVFQVLSDCVISFISF